MEDVGLLKNVRLRYNKNGYLLGIDYRKDGKSAFQKVIIRSNGPNDFTYRTDYLNNVENLIEWISNMDWFHEDEVMKDDAADAVYNRQMKYIEDNIKDIEKRITEEEAKADARDKELIKAYKELRDYLDLNIDILNVFFWPPLEGRVF